MSETVRLEVAKRFPAQQHAELIEFLEQTPLPFLDHSDRSRDRDRVHCAVLLAAGGNATEFLSALALAATDWRDLLVATGLADADWPEVLERSGFPRL